MDGIGFIKYQAHSLIYFAIFRSIHYLKVALGYWNKNYTQIKLSFDCIGSIISESFVLIAGRCAKLKRFPAIIRPGKWNRQHSVLEYQVNETVFEPIDNDTIPDYHVKVKTIRFQMRNSNSILK